jgi:hypothetical protein
MATGLKSAHRAIRTRAGKSLTSRPSFIVLSLSPERRAVVATDYQGLGVADFHPFLQAVGRMRVTRFDLLCAARTLESRIERTARGHSQAVRLTCSVRTGAGPSYVPEFGWQCRICTDRNRRPS